MMLFRSSAPPGNDDGKSIGLSLVALVLVAVVPLVVFAAGVAWTIINQKKAAVADELAATARALSVAVDRELLNQIPAMQILATDVSLANGDHALFIERARRALDVHREWRNVALIDPTTHQIVASTVPVPSPPPKTLATAEVDEVARTRKPRIVGVFAAGRLHSAPMNLLLAPVLRKDEVRLVLAVTVHTKSLSNVFAEQRMPAAWTGAIVDTRMTLAGRSREAERYVGVRATDTLAQRIAASAGGMFTALNLDGDTDYTVFSRSALTGWSVAIGVPAAEVEGPIRSVLIKLAAAGGGLIALALVPAGLVGRGIVRRRNAYEQERKRAEQALKHSERHLRAIIETEPECVKVVDRAGQLLEMNAAGLAMLEADSVAEAQRHTLLGFLLPEYRAAFGELHQRVMGGASGTLEFEILGLKGTRRWLETHAAPMRDDAGNVAMLLGITRDVTERKLKQDEYRTIIQASLDGFWITDFSTRILDANESICRMLGYTRGELLGMSIRDIDADEEPADIAERTRAMIATGSARFLARHRRKDGTINEVEVSVLHVATLGDRLFAFVRDVTERKRAEDALRVSEERYRFMTENIKDVVWVLDTETMHFRYVSPSVERLRGYTADEIMAVPVTHALTPQAAEYVTSLTRRRAANLLAGKEPPGRFYTNEFEQPCKDGSSVWTEVITSYYIDAETGRVEVRGVTRDITERKRAEADHAQLEAQLRESQKMEALGTLAGGIAHDFNNIVAAILGNVELARQDVGPAHAALTSLEEIRKASRRAKDLVQQILAFGRRQVLEREVIELAPVMQETAKLLRATLPAGIDLNVACAPDTPAVLADATQIEQVVLNLCSNAWQALQGQDRPGVIDIRLEPQVRGGARFASLIVSDNGCGMDEATRERIFEPFFTTKPLGEGTGLGLSVVHGIAEEHGASIELHSRPGEGTCFAVHFPAAQIPDSAAIEADARATGPDPGETARLRSDGKRVLYLDDDESIVFLMTRMLERQGYLVSGYTDVYAALGAVRAGPADFDMVVTDYNMPGMSGLEVARALKEIRADLPVALASGYITEELREQAPDAGVRELIYKPNTVDELCEVVARLANAHLRRDKPQRPDVPESDS